MLLLNYILNLLKLQNDIKPINNIIFFSFLTTGDLITLFDSADLAAAIAYSRVLKLTLFVNGKIVRSTGHGINIASSNVDPNIIQELRAIRDKVNQVLDVLGNRDGSVPGGITENTLQVKSVQNEMTNGSEHPDVIAADSEKSLQDLKLESKEFDPLQRSQFVVTEPHAVPFTAGHIPDDQQSVSSSASANKGEVPAPPPAVTPVTSGAAPVQQAPPPAQQQTYPAAAYPGIPAVNQQQQQPGGAPTMSPMPPIYPGYTPTSGVAGGQVPPQQLPGQHPSGPQPQQVPQHPQVQQPQSNQMSAFVGFPGQQAAQQPPAAPRPTSAAGGPQVPTVQQPQSFYPPGPPRPQGMPMPGNPYGMVQRGQTTPGFRYPQPGQGYR